MTLRVETAFRALQTHSHAHESYMSQSTDHIFLPEVTACNHPFSDHPCRDLDVVFEFFCAGKQVSCALSCIVQATFDRQRLLCAIALDLRGRVVRMRLENMSADVVATK